MAAPLLFLLKLFGFEGLSLELLCVLSLRVSVCAGAPRPYGCVSVHSSLCS